MKKYFGIPILLLLLAIGLFALKPHQKEMALPVNPLIGDLSFVQKFGHLPDANTDEDLRIRTHFEYVEAYLRGVDVHAMAPELQEQRTQMLDHLHDYATAGIFPRNYDHPGERRPCFIDRDGRICAVGYLVEQSAGRDVATQINDGHQYDRLLAMNDESVDNWIAGSGLTKTECAMIQPTYGWQPNNPPNYSHISRGSAIASAGFGGLNLSITALNGLQIFKHAPGKVLPIIGMVSGVGQIALGAATMPRTNYDGNWGYINNSSQQNLSMLNIGMGTASVVFSVANLVMNRPAKQKQLSWNLYGYPAGQKQVGLGFSLTKVM